MTNWSKRITATAIVLGGLVAVTAVAAGATGLGGHGGGPVGGTTKIGSGNDLGVGVGNVSPNLPVNVCGNNVGVIGNGVAGCKNHQETSSKGKAKVDNGDGKGHKGKGRRGGHSSSSNSLLSDNDLGVGVGNVSPNIPVNVCGNNVLVLGNGVAGCKNHQDTSSKGKAKVDND